MSRVRWQLLAFSLAWSSLCAQESVAVSGLDPYRPERSVDGTIRNFGNNYIPKLMAQWEEGFRRFQPGIRFETDLKGTEAALAGLYGKIADVAFVGREVYDIEAQAFKEQFGYEPLSIEISSGSFDTPHKTFALMVFVHKDNPIAKLSMSQLDAIYSCDRRGGAAHPIRKWGDLGLTGEWATRPIQVYGYVHGTGMAAFFRRNVLKGSGRWYPDSTDFDNGRSPDGEVINAGVYILNALARDPWGIGYANVRHRNPDVKPLSLSENDSGPWIEPTRENVWLRTYPLTRFTSVCINRPPGRPVDPKVREFLRYILSRDGMEAVAREGDYLPLTRDEIQRQLAKLD